MTAERWRWVGLGAIALLAAVFAFANAGERVALRLGFVTLYQISLVVLILVAFLLGMLTMFLLGLRHDLRVRRILAEHHLLDLPAANSRVSVDDSPAGDVTEPYTAETDATGTVRREMDPVAPSPPHPQHPPP